MDLVTRTEAFDAALARLVAARDLDDDHYAALSDLSANEANELRQRWQAVPAELRTTIMARAAELVDDRIDLDFAALATIGLQDEEPDVRLSALEALGDGVDRRIGERVQRLLESDGDERVRAAAAVVLRQFVVAREFEQLNREVGDAIVEALRMRVLDAQEDELVRSLALESLGPRSVAWLPALIDDAYASDDRSMRLASIRAMADSVDERWLDYLIEQLDADDPEFRFEAATACGALGLDDAIEPLSRLLADDNQEVVLAAVEALGEIGGSVAVEELRAFQDHVPPGMEALVERALAAAREVAHEQGEEEDEDQ